MTKRILIKGATLVNEGISTVGDVLVVGERIAKIASAISATPNDQIIEATGLTLLPGVIDDQVHFRQPGLTHKADLFTESRAAVAGGVTSYLEMPNTSPAAVTIERVEEKYRLASQTSMANYGFFIGASNDNLEELLRVPKSSVPGVKIFMGSSTGDLLVDNPKSLEAIFEQVRLPITTHCEDEPTIRENSRLFREKYGENLPVTDHPKIRSAEACYRSSSHAVELAKRYKARLHVLHISTAKELDLFTPNHPHITAEACVHHLWFSDEDYATLGTRIKWNPAIKTVADRTAIRTALSTGQISVVASDHAPHTLEEKALPYFQCPSGGPLVQHTLPAMLTLVKQGVLTIERLVQLMCHEPADLFRIAERGYLREGYFADMVLVDTNSQSQPVSKDNILYKCGWSPFEGITFEAQIKATFVNGNCVFNGQKVIEGFLGQRLRFDSRFDET